MTVVWISFPQVNFEDDFEWMVSNFFHDTSDFPSNHSIFVICDHLLYLLSLCLGNVPCSAISIKFIFDQIYSFFSSPRRVLSQYQPISYK